MNVGRKVSLRIIHNSRIMHGHQLVIVRILDDICSLPFLVYESLFFSLLNSLQLHSAFTSFHFTPVIHLSLIHIVNSSCCKKREKKHEKPPLSGHIIPNTNRIKCVSCRCNDIHFHIFITNIYLVTFHEWLDKLKDTVKKDLAKNWIGYTLSWFSLNEILPNYHHPCAISFFMPEIDDVDAFVSKKKI